MFEDFGFKLVVINSLLGKETSFAKELAEMQEKYVDEYDGDGYEYIAMCEEGLTEEFEKAGIEVE